MLALSSIRARRAVGEHEVQIPLINLFRETLQSRENAVYTEVVDIVDEDLENGEALAF